MIDSANGSTAGAPAVAEPGSSVVVVYRRVEMAFTVLSRCCFDAGYRSRSFGVVAEPHQSRVSTSGFVVACQGADFGGDHRYAPDSEADGSSKPSPPAKPGMLSTPVIEKCASSRFLRN